MHHGLHVLNPRNPTLACARWGYPLSSTGTEKGTGLPACCMLGSDPIFP